MLCIDNVVYMAHRVVYYLRTAQDPQDLDVLHEASNPDKDNRKPLLVSDKYTRKQKSKNLYLRSFSE